MTMSYRPANPVMPYVVTTPRVMDAVGGALRDAYIGTEMPDDMQALLDRLYDIGERRMSGEAKAA